MSFLNIHIKTFTDEQWHSVVKPALAAAGHEVESFALSEADKLVGMTKAKFPELVADIKKLIADAKNKDAKGIDKLEAVALDALKTFPDVLKALPNVKDFAISLAQSVYQDGLAELEKVAGEIIRKIL